MVKAIIQDRHEKDVPRGHERKIASIIRNGILRKEKLESIRQAIEENNQKLLPYARQLTDTTGLKKAEFKSDIGSTKVVFSDTLKYDKKDMGAIKTILGPIFTQVFHEVKVFAVNPEDIPEIKERLGKDFENLVQVQPVFKHTTMLLELLSDGDSVVGNKLRKFVSIKPNKPSVSYERNAEKRA